MIPSSWSQEQGTAIDIMDACFARDPSFDFNTPLLSSSSASSPTYDSCDPFTPRSGRSTPHASALDFGDSFSSHGSFSFESAAASLPIHQQQQQQHHKSHHHNHQHYHRAGPMDMPLQYSASMPLTPSRRQFHGMDIDYNTMLQATLNQQCMSTMSPAQPTMMEQYASMPQDLQSSPFTMPTPSRSLPSSTPNHAANMWPCNDSPIMMFGNHGTPSPSPLQSMPLKREQDSPTPPPSRSYRRRTMTEAQRRTMALQRHQSEMMYRSQHDSEAMAQLRSMKLDQQSAEEELDSVFIDRRVVPRPRERCDFMGCRKTYQKKEHLKRHQRAAHGIGGTPEMHTCPADGCHKVFKDRFDNFKQHLRIHKDGKSTRTPYNEEAAQLYDELCKQSKTRNTKKGLRATKA